MCSHVPLVWPAPRPPVLPGCSPQAYTVSAMRVLDQPGLEAGALGEGDLGVGDDGVERQPGEVGGLIQGIARLVGTYRAAERGGHGPFDQLLDVGQQLAQASWPPDGLVDGGDVEGVELARLEAVLDACSWPSTPYGRPGIAFGFCGLLPGREAGQVRRSCPASSAGSRSAGTTAGSRTARSGQRARAVCSP